MATLTNGILGHLHGSIGDLVFYKLRGMQVVRAKGIRSNQDHTPAQLAQMARFKLAADFLQGLKGLLKISCKEKRRMTGRNRAIWHLLKNAVNGNYPYFRIDYPKIELAQGSRIPAEAVKTSSITQGCIDFNWTYSQERLDAAPDDQSILVAHCPELNYSIYNLSDARRGTKTAVWEIPDFKGKQVHTWLGFVNKRKEVSNFIYGGEVRII